jgi:nicotinate-nucleotide pyrophosphorylase (carboxylating)
MNEKLLSSLVALVGMAYEEDGPVDVTSERYIDAESEGLAVVVAKESGVLAGLAFVEHMIRGRMEVTVMMADGDSVFAGNEVMTLSGNVRDLLRAERIMLNFLQRMSGIATLTRQFVDLCAPFGVKVLDTRKTLPGYRFLDKYSTQMGGAMNHRMNMSDMMMVKDTHVDWSGGMEVALEQLLSAPVNVPVEVEVRDFEELDAVLAIPDDSVLALRIMLDNFSVDDVKRAVRIINNRFAVEVSGTISLETVEAYAKALSAADDAYVSVGALTHSLKAFDLSLRKDWK